METRPDGGMLPGQELRTARSVHKEGKMTNRIGRRTGTFGAVLSAAVAFTVSGTALAHASTSAPYLSYGDTGTGVKCVQMAANEAGFNAGSVDGIWGKQTESAVEAFQRANFGYSDGIVGPQTGDAMWSRLAYYHAECYWFLPTSY